MSTTDLNLPHRSSPRIHLVRATVAENIAQTVTNSVEWRGPLTQDGYMRREAHLADQVFTRNGGLMAWMLVEQLDGLDDDGQPRRRILCGCETLRKRALAVGDEPDGGNETREVLAYGVCSVFCANELRGRGYASRMIMELGKRLEQGVDPEDASLSAIPTSESRSPRASIQKPLFSVLYSDIGKQFYAAHGWTAYPSAHLAFPPAPPSATLPEGVRYLSKSELPELCAIDEAQLRRQMPQILAARKQTNSKTKAAIAVAPDYPTLEWQLAREAFVTKEALGKAPDVHGAIVEVSPGRRAWCYFNRMLSATDTEEDPHVLHIMRIVVEEGSQPGIEHDEAVLQALPGLFRAAQIQAREWGMRQVQLWNPDDSVRTTALLMDAGDRDNATGSQRIAVVEREQHSITSMRWFGADHARDGVEWLCNEKFAWC